MSRKIKCVGIGIGVMRGGVIGGIISFPGFTLPFVIPLVIFVSLLNMFGIEDAGCKNRCWIIVITSAIGGFFYMERGKW